MIQAEICFEFTTSIGTKYHHIGIRQQFFFEQQHTGHKKSMILPNASTWGYRVSSRKIMNFSYLVYYQQKKSGQVPVYMMVVYSYRTCEIKTCFSLYYRDHSINWYRKGKDRASSLKWERTSNYHWHYYWKWWILYNKMFSIKKLWSSHRWTTNIYQSITNTISWIGFQTPYT